MDVYSRYWEDCIAEAACECGLSLPQEQLECLAGFAQAGHENYGMAFYSPSTTDRMDGMRREEAVKLKRLQEEFDAYKRNAENAIKRALEIDDAEVGIEKGGWVTKYAGRTERVLL